MSRIGKKPILIPQGVEFKIEGNKIMVKGPKGSLSREISKNFQLKAEEGLPGQGRLVILRESDDKKERSLHGLFRTLIANMIEGVLKGFEKTLELSGVGYRASLSGKNLKLLIGYSKPVEIQPPAGIEFVVPAPEKIIVKGFDKERVGQIAAKIRAVRTVEPYKGKGIKYAGEKVRRKAGKVAKAAAA